MRQEQSTIQNSKSGIRDFGAETRRLLQVSINRQGKEKLQRFAAKARAKSLRQPDPVSIRNVSAGFEFDVDPRLVVPEQWNKLARGIEQRASAVDAFLQDLYGEATIVRLGILDEMTAFECIYSPSLGGFTPPGRSYSILSSVEMAVGGNGKLYCVEKGNPSAWDIANLRANRFAMRMTFPEIFAEGRIASTKAFWTNYRSALLKAAGNDFKTSCIAVASESPSLEIDFIADRMAAKSTIWNDFRIANGRVALRTTEGLKPIDVVCHFGDHVPDPLFSGDPKLSGTAGVLSVYRAAGIMIGNAPDAGVAANNKVHAIVPEMINFYLDEEPLLENWPCWLGEKAGEMQWILDNLSQLQILKASEFGGRPLFDGTKAGKGEIEKIRKRIEVSPADFVAKLPSTETSLSEHKRVSNPKGSERLTFFAVRRDERFVAVDGGISKSESNPDPTKFSGNSRIRDLWIIRGGNGAVSAF